MFLLGQFICVRVSYFVFCVFPLCYCLVVSASAIHCLEGLVSEMTYYVLSGMLNTVHSLTFCVCVFLIVVRFCMFFV